MFVLGSAVTHIDGRPVERAEWPDLDGKWIAVDRTTRDRDGRRQATAARIVERPAPDRAAAAAPTADPLTAGA